MACRTNVSKPIATTDACVLERAADLLRAQLGDVLSTDHPLAPMTTYRVGGAAALFINARTIDVDGGLPISCGESRVVAR